MSRPVKILMSTLAALLGALTVLVVSFVWVNMRSGEDLEASYANLPTEISARYDVDDAWWKYTSVYQIYPRSFNDSDGDGIGDLGGVIAKLDYIHSLGFETIWLSPFFASPQQDHGYDVSDYLDVAPEYGSLPSVDSLIRGVHARGMRVVLDLVLNHTSIEHPWFKESRSSRDNPKADWYVWRDGRNGDPPNNWNNIPSQGSAWNYAAERGQWYYAAFLPFQPDLNMRHPEVRAAMLDVVRFWLDRGVDGFRLDIFNFVFEDTSFADNPWTLRMLPDMARQQWMFEERRYNMNRPESFAFAQELRAVLEEYDDPPRFMVGEVFGTHDVLRKLLGAERYDGLNLVFLFDILDGFRFTAHYFREKVRTYERFYPEPFVPTYVFSNHDQVRSITRLGDDPEKAKLLALFQLSVRGATFTYQGEEVGMTTGTIPVEDGQDPLASGWTRFPAWLRKRVPVLFNRDNARTPMQWSAADNAGFSAPGVRTWLPIQANYRDINVESAESDPRSVLHVYRRLLHLRQQHVALLRGSLRIVEVNTPPHVLAYVREADGERVMALLNFSGEPQSVVLGENGYTTVLFAIRPEDAIEGRDVTLSPFGGILLR